MIQELDTVVLTRDVSEYKLLAGDVGAVVHVHTPTTFEVEFVTGDGQTVALLTLTDRDVRPRTGRDLLRVREYPTPVS